MMRKEAISTQKSADNDVETTTVDQKTLPFFEPPCLTRISTAEGQRKLAHSAERILGDGTPIESS